MIWPDCMHKNFLESYNVTRKIWSFDTITLFGHFFLFWDTHRISVANLMHVWPAGFPQYVLVVFLFWQVCWTHLPPSCVEMLFGFFKGICLRLILNWKVWVKIDGLDSEKKGIPLFESGKVMQTTNNPKPPITQTTG